MRKYIEEAEREREDRIMRQKEKQRQWILKRNYVPLFYMEVTEDINLT